MITIGDDLEDADYAPECPAEFDDDQSDHAHNCTDRLEHQAVTHICRCGQVWHDGLGFWQGDIGGPW